MDQNISVLKTTQLLGQQFTMFGTAENPLFKAKDIAAFLSLTNVSDMIKRVDQEELTKLNLGSMQGDTWFLTEDGLYEVLMQSRKPIAKEFKQGVKKVLREIRQQGGYIASNEQDTPEVIMARALQVAQATLERHKQQLESAQTTIRLQSEQLQEQAPKVEYTDIVLQSANTYTTTQIAKELDFRSPEMLHNKLKQLGVMIRQSGQWMLSAKYCGLDYTRPRTHYFTRANGSQGTNTITVWTEKGRMFLHQLINGNLRKQ